jgi:3-oxoacyl-[acyl-carrier protein] reductase
MQSTPPNRDALRLDGKRAVVTGSSAGIGRAIALELAAAGADVLVHGRTQTESAEAVAQSICELGQRADVVMLDLADPRNHAILVERAWSWARRIDIWINNAGADVLTGPAADWTFDDKLRQLWQVDVAATVGLGRRVGQRMRGAAGQADHPTILNMGWDQAETGMAGDSGEMFACVKGAVIAFTRSLAKSLAPSVRVNCLAPGWIRTAWGETASPDWQRRVERESLLRRWGTSQDVAWTARFLVSPAAAYLTGQVIAINGGFDRSVEDESE